MATTPTGILSTPLAALRELVAGSSAFQAWIGGDEAMALTRVHLLVAPAKAERPYALVDFDTPFARDRYAVTNKRSWVQRPGSSMLLWIQADADDTLDEPDATLDFCNHLGAVWADLENNAGQYDQQTFAASAIDLVVAPLRVETENRRTAGDYFEACMAIAMTRQP